jgi:hypothetical protein
MPTKKPRCPNGSRRKPPKTGKCVKTKKRSTASQKRSFLKGIKSKSKSKTKTLTLPSNSSSQKRSFLKGIKSKSSSKSKSKTKKKGNYRSFIGCEMKRLKKQNPNMRQASIMKMAAKNWKKQ